MHKLTALLLCLALALTAFGAFAETVETEAANPAETTEAAGTTEAKNEEEAPVVRISVENAGDIYVELCPDAAPATVANFLSLVDQGFYNGLTFHRIISGFMIQGGDPSGNGTGGSPETIPGEFAANGFEGNTLAHTRGAISMARSSDMNSASSQFFIVHADSPHLNGQYAAFGSVLAGMGTVDRLCVSVRTGENGAVPAVMQPRITAIVRSTREEALAAAAAEESNGRGGSDYVDPVTGLRVTLPAGWEMAQRLNLMTAFTEKGENGENGRAVMLSAQDFWLYYNGLYGGDVNASGMHRGEFNSAFLGKDSLIGAITGASAESFAEEVHGGVTWYVGRVAGQDGSTGCIAIGVADGIFMALQGSEDCADVITAILDGIVPYPASLTAEDEAAAPTTEEAAGTQEE